MKEGTKQGRGRMAEEEEGQSVGGLRCGGVLCPSSLLLTLHCRQTHRHHHHAPTDGRSNPRREREAVKTSGRTKQETGVERRREGGLFYRIIAGGERRGEKGEERVAEKDRRTNDDDEDVEAAAADTTREGREKGGKRRDLLLLYFTSVLAGFYSPPPSSLVVSLPFPPYRRIPFFNSKRRMPGSFVRPLKREEKEKAVSSFPSLVHSSVHCPNQARLLQLLPFFSEAREPSSIDRPSVRPCFFSSPFPLTLSVSVPA